MSMHTIPPAENLPTEGEAALAEMTGLTVAQVRIADHIEMAHERELAMPLDGDQIEGIHADMHQSRDDWGHVHDWNREPVL